MLNTILNLGGRVDKNIQIEKENKPCRALLKSNKMNFQRETPSSGKKETPSFFPEEGVYP